LVAGKLVKREQNRLEEPTEKVLQAACHTGRREDFNLDDTRTQ